MRSLTDSVGVLKGVGPKMVEDLAGLDILTVEDLLLYFPFRFEDIKERELTDISDGEKVVLKGVVVSEATVNYFGPRKSRLAFRLMQDGVVISVSFFNQPYLAQKVEAGGELAVFGKWDAKKRALTGMKIIGAKNTDDYQPVYHVVKSLSQSKLVKAIQLAFELYGDLIVETLPQAIVEQYHLLDRYTAIWQMHFPKADVATEEARRRIVFEEFFYFQLKMLSLKISEQKNNRGEEIHYDNAKLKKFIQALPFELTGAQKRVTNEICRDLLAPFHMQRLLQGDVGSGKTAVAALAMYAVMTTGRQTALMVPTEILAQQHAVTMAKFFEHVDGVNVAMLTSGLKAKARREILAGLADGTINLVIGTHALIQADVEFARLGLVVTDEQHRFGVNQRKLFRQKGVMPEVLMMTATPIPRTLAITAYGEMDVSVIDELPAGRQPITTRWVKPPQLSVVLDFIGKKLAGGDQAYFISPLIAESEMLDLKNAEQLFSELTIYFNQFRVGLLHGRMKNEEKEDVMTAFKAHELDILVSTTVIEVGVDVPNATMMIIMDADRFGLAQLHQLRGRVGRGAKASLCVLVADPKGESGKERMKIMTETTDGFVLSQKDLEMRGPGEFFGARQSGVPQFHLGDLARDEDILEIAQSSAKEIVMADNRAELLNAEPLASNLAKQHFTSYFD